jgi:hypothetical protein
VDSLAVWTELNGPKKLHRVEAIWGSADSGMYVMLFAKNVQTDGDKPLWRSPLLTNDGATVMCANFGEGGFSPFFNDAGTARKGCTLAFSTSATALVQPLDTPGYIKAFFIK